MAAVSKPNFVPLPPREISTDEELLARAANFYSEMARRRTVRDFSDRPIPRAVIENCLRTAGSAPNGANLQPWHFVAVGDPALKHEIHALTDITGFGISGHGLEMATGSGVRIVLSFKALPLYPGAVEMYAAGVSTSSNAGNRALCGERLRFEVKLRGEQEEVLFDPQTSGGLLAALPEAQAREYVRDLHEAGLPWAAIVGHAESGEPGITVR